jgi:hypothetical protein
MTSFGGLVELKHGSEVLSRLSILEGSNLDFFLKTILVWKMLIQLFKNIDNILLVE